MAGKVSGVTHPANLADGATVNETYVDNVTNSIIGLDGALAKIEPIYVTTTKVTVANTTDETTLWTYTVPGNTLGTGNMINFESRGFVDNGTGSLEVFTFKLYYGSTTVSIAPGVTNGVNECAYQFTGSIMADGATDAQIAEINALPSGAIWGSGDQLSGNYSDSFAEDSTGDLVLKLTITMTGPAAADLRCVQFWARLFLCDIS